MDLHAARLRKCWLTIIASMLLLVAVAASAQEGGRITTCGTNVDRWGTWELANDLNCTGTNAIEITVSGVMLYLRGHTITGSPPYYGITIAAGKNEIYIYGPGTIRGFGVGVYTGSGSELISINHVMVTGASTGFVSESSVLWAGNSASGNYIGFWLDAGSDRSDVAGNSATDNEWEGFFVASAHNDLGDNKSENNGYAGIDIKGTDNEIRRNVAHGNTTADLIDRNEDCDHNKWERNDFGTRNQDCIH
jgi:parallel beta-helix repeat protein